MIHKTLSPEHIILLEVTRCVYNNSMLEEDFFQEYSFSWDVLYRLAAFHRIVPALIHLVKKELIPSEVSSQIDARIMKLYAEELRQQRVIECLMQRCREAELPILFLKGAAFKSLLYGDTFPRRMGDIDVLVHSEDKERMDSLLSELGYRRHLGEESYVPYAWHQRCHNYVRTVIANDRTEYLSDDANVDVHYRLSYILGDRYASLNEAFVWKHQGSENGLTVPSIEDSLIHLFIHFIHSLDFQPCSMRSFLDLALLIAHLDRALPDVLKSQGHEFDAEVHNEAIRFQTVLQEFFIEGVAMRQLSEVTNRYLHTLFVMGQKKEIDSYLIYQRLTPFLKVLYRVGYFFPDVEYYQSKNINGIFAILKAHYAYVFARLFRR